MATIIEKKEKKKEIKWLHRLNTIFPNGMNSEVMYQSPKA